MAVAFLGQWFLDFSDRRLLTSVMSGLLVSLAVLIREIVRVSPNMVAMVVRGGDGDDGGSLSLSLSVVVVVMGR